MHDRARFITPVFRSRCLVDLHRQFRSLEVPRGIRRGFARRPHSAPPTRLYMDTGRDAEVAALLAQAIERAGRGVRRPPGRCAGIPAEGAAGPSAGGRPRVRGAGDTSGLSAGPVSIPCGRHGRAGARRVRAMDMGRA